jgi:hypothetical protein
MAHRVWRQFRPTVRRKRQLDRTDIVTSMHSRLEELLDRHHGAHGDDGIDWLDNLVEEQVVRIISHPTAVEWLTLLILRAPGAARAQHQMDKHPHGHQGQQARLFELIDFNDAFVSTVLALTDTQRSGFIETAKREIDAFCERVGSRTFSDGQFEAITHGLSREVAVYLGAIEQGFSVAMTARGQDAMGVDMVITDPASGKSLNIDCKTASSYHYRIKDLVEQGRMSEDEGRRAEELGYAHEINGHGAEAVAVTLLRVDPNEVGDIVDFSFIDSQHLGNRLKLLFLSEPSIGQK